MEQDASETITQINATAIISLPKQLAVDNKATETENCSQQLAKNVADDDDESNTDQQEDLITTSTKTTTTITTNMEEEVPVQITKDLEENVTNRTVTAKSTTTTTDNDTTQSNEATAAEEAQQTNSEIQKISAHKSVQQEAKVSQKLKTTTTTTNSKSNVNMKLTDSVTEEAEAALEVQETPKISHADCLAQLDTQRTNYEQQIENLLATLQQKDNMISLFQRENTILEKEKQAFRKERDLATKEKEATVIKFAMKEKLLIDAKKEKEVVEKQLADAKREIKNVSTRFQAVNEEKSRVTYLMDEKCNEIRKYQRECEKYKTEINHLESKLKYNFNRLNIETEAKMALEKKLEEERNAPNKLEEKANEKLKMEFEANTILLRHEVKSKTEMLEHSNKELHKAHEIVKQLQEQLSREIITKDELSKNFELLQQEHNSVQNSYSEEMLNSAKLRGQLEELQVLRTQNMLNEEKINTLSAYVAELEEKLADNATDLQELHAKEVELLSFNKELTESVVGLQNELCMITSKSQGLEAENELFKKEKLGFDNKYAALEEQLKEKEEQNAEERQLLTKHLSEKTKLYELTKIKLENVIGDFEATKNKHATVVKELQRELNKFKKSMEHTSSATTTNSKNSANRNATLYCNNCQHSLNGIGVENNGDVAAAAMNATQLIRSHSRNSSHSGYSGGGGGGAGEHSRRVSETSESETVASNITATNVLHEEVQGPSKKHLVERILRLQQASARQTEKIDFLENHTLSLVAELQKKAKVVQYYMLRDEAGALTSSKSDQNKWELAKYGNGVMSAIYNGLKGDTKGMTLELSLEINKKLQAVLEDTLLKNITLKENLDVLGLEVDNLTRKLRQMEAK